AVRSLNKVMLIGNLTRDPNLRFTPKGTAVCSFGLATNRSWTPADGGEKQERVEFHNVVAWAKLAEICGQLLHKGDKVYLEGRLQTREWKGDDDQSRRTTEVVIDNMILLRSAGGYSGGQGNNKNDGNDNSGDSSGDNNDDNDGDSPEELKKESPAKEAQVEVEDVADDIPF
ncbi:single-stranded DNA-binding protein, partial [Patescibacteria group bacterium]|nr:single-stranded DNA-binding protein [Patescibacteria group bacterium]